MEHKMSDILTSWQREQRQQQKGVGGVTEVEMNSSGNCLLPLNLQFFDS